MSTSTSSVTTHIPTLKGAPQALENEAAASVPVGVSAVASSISEAPQELRESGSPVDLPHGEGLARDDSSCCCGLGEMICGFFAALGNCFQRLWNWLCCVDEDPLQSRDPNGQDYADDIDAQGRTALHSACLNEEVAKARQIVNWGKVDLNAPDNSGEVPLHIACEKMSNGLVISLLSGQGTGKKARVDALDAQGQTPLHRLCKAEMPRDGADHIFPVKILERLSQEPNFHVNVLDDEWFTPLHLAAQTGKVEIVQKLLELRANVNAQDKKGRTPLALMALPNRLDKSSKIATGRALLAGGADPKIWFSHDHKKRVVNPKFIKELRKPLKPAEDTVEFTENGTMVAHPHPVSTPDSMEPEFD